MLQKLKERWGLLLLSLPLVGLGVGFLYLGVLLPLSDWTDMKNWEPVQAQIVSAKMKRNYSDGSTTYRAESSYRYQYQGQSYSGDRVDIGTGSSSDNDFEYHREILRPLVHAQENNITVTGWVNPEEPEQAVLNRDLRLGHLLLAGVFSLIFGALALGIWAYVLLARPDKTGVSETQAKLKPWLARRDWASATIKSSGKTIMIFAWCFAIFWNLIAIPTGINCIVEFLDGNTVALVGLLFPLVGAGLVFWAVKETAKWRRFGPAPLQLDPYPGAIGGQFGGTIDVKLPYDRAHAFKVTLQCLESYYTGSGKDRKRRENCVWQREGYAHTQRSSYGTLLELLFDVDTGLPESEPEANRYHLWRLHVVAELTGADFDRSYEVPVFATGASAVQVRSSSENHEQALQEREQLLDSALDIQQIPGGIAMHYPAFKSAGAKLVGIIFGAVAFTAGYFIDADFMGPLFMGIGAVVVLPCLYFLLTSLDVTFNRQQLITQRKLLGINLSSTSVARSELTHLEIAESYSSQSGNSHATFYKVQAHRCNGRPVTIGYSFKGEAVAKQALESISLLTGVPEA